MKTQTNLWLGNQASYEIVVEAGLKAYSEDDRSEREYPTILQKQDNVGIINIKGSLINGEAGFMSYFGVTGYGDIRNALAAAISDPSVGSILLNVDSGGGAVAGVHETAQLIARVNKIKPVVSYTGGTQASAALWLGSSARQSYVAETGIVGSLGVIMIHAERSKQLEDDGIKVTVIRAGTEKATANPYEPLSDAAKASLEEKAQVMYDIFLGHVAEQRGLSTEVADKKFGQGREFIGKQAVEAGLVDAVGSLEDAFMKAKGFADKIVAKAQAAGQLPKRTNSVVRADNLASVLSAAVSDIAILADNASTSEGTPMPKPLTQEQLAAMAAGVSLEATDTPAVAEVPVVTTEPAADAPATDTAATSDLASYLTTQVKELQAELVSLKVSAAAQEAALATYASTVDSLATIARASMKTMTVALGGDTAYIANLSPTELAIEHAKTASVFANKFKVGAVAATNTSEQSKQVTATLDPRLAAQALKLPSGKR